jgi:hypothetical protein
MTNLPDMPDFSTSGSDPLPGLGGAAAAETNDAISAEAEKPATPDAFPLEEPAKPSAEPPQPSADDASPAEEPPTEKAAEKKPAAGPPLAPPKQ